MKRVSTTATVVLAVIAVAFSTLVASPASAAPTTRQVGPGKPYATIGSAVAASVDGDTVLVDAGTYRENVAIIGKYITLTGGIGGETIIQYNPTQDSNHRSPLFIQSVPALSTKSLNISGFTITGGNIASGMGGGVTVDQASPVLHDLTIRGNYAAGYGGGVSITYGSNPLIYDCVISGNTALLGGGGVFAVQSSSPVLVDNTITGNSTSGSAFGNGGSSGGGVYFENIPGNNAARSTPVLFGNTITNNTASFAGGGVMLRTGVNAMIQNNTISGNSTAYGGGIHVETGGSASTIYGNTIANNTATYNATFIGSGNGGGIAIYDHSTPTIAANTITGNVASHYGAGIVSAEGANSQITGNVISANSFNSAGSFTDRDGGGMYVARSTATLTNNVIADNTADKGGGIALLNESVTTIVNNTIVKNHEATLWGGAIFVDQTITSSTIANNILTQNQGAQIFEPFKKARIDNNLITTPSSPPASSGSALYFGYNTNAVNSISTLNSSSSIDASGNVSSSPQFVDFSGNNFAIGSTSGAIDGSTAVTVPSLTTDIRNVARNGVIDIGAYEYSANPVNTYLPTMSGTPEVSKSLFVSGGTWGPAPASLSYQWVVTGNVPGATSPSYSPRLADVGSTVSATVTATWYGVHVETVRTGASGPVTRGAYFGDVASTHPFHSQIEWMAASSISTGTPNSPYAPLYKPDDPVSRAAMALFLYRLSGDSFTAPAEPTFADVGVTHTAYVAVEWMAANGISTGTAQPTGKPLFAPADVVTRQVMAIFLARYAGADTSTQPTELSFADVPLTSTPAAAIEWMKDNGISTGTVQPSGLPLYKPADPVSRQAMAAFLSRLEALG